MDAHEEAEQELAAIQQQQQQHGGDKDSRVAQTCGEENKDSPFDVFLRESHRVLQSILASEENKNEKPDIHVTTDQKPDRDDTNDADDEAITVTLPSNAEIELLGRQVRFKHLTVLVNNINYCASGSEIIHIFKEFGFLRNVHMPCHRPNQPESHRGFVLLTFVTAHEVSAALRGCRARLDEAGHGGARVWRLADYRTYHKYCEGLDVAAVMTCRGQAASGRVEKQKPVAARVVQGRIKKRKSPFIHRTTGCYARSNINHQRTSREDIRPEEDVRSYLWRRLQRPQHSRKRKKSKKGS
ncbi:uncharacterized protein LOC126998684 [Eriocheir sinensis]|uniref:uncharacterized protein LOC126998684 n=1 Tax=Eriocheir sinensis TaxID=95602 RepID=UPI0021C976C5|nr:uncharacterized protein LOC126998684 [Eriocheir sinensis]